MTLSRRDFLMAGAAFAAFPTHALSAESADIAIIGAGVAGIAAARRIAAIGRSVVILEAGRMIGGRAITDTQTFGAPFDRGAHWIYTPDRNPLARLARSVGIEIYPAPPGQKIHIGRRNARPSEMEDFLSAQVRIKRAIDDAARGKTDIAAMQGFPADATDWSPTVQFLLGPSAFGKDLSDISGHDYASAAERDSAVFCRQGVGALIAALGAGLPVSLGTPATRVVRKRGGVEIETPSGKLTARAAIVTVSTHVLGSGRIAFSPALPKRLSDAVAGLSLGSYDHIALDIPGNPFGLRRDDFIAEKASGRETASLLANIGGSSLYTVDVAGSFGRDLAAQGEAAMVAFAKDYMVRLFGSDAEGAIKRATATRWNADPLIGGAFSAAAPGHHGARKILSEPLGRLFFAGEAVHETLWGTVGGAWESGERAAEEALRAIGALKEEPPKPSRKSRKRRR